MLLDSRVVSASSMSEALSKFEYNNDRAYAIDMTFEWEASKKPLNEDLDEWAFNLLQQRKDEITTIVVCLDDGSKPWASYKPTTTKTVVEQKVISRHGGAVKITESTDIEKGESPDATIATPLYLLITDEEQPQILNAWSIKNFKALPNTEYSGIREIRQYINREFRSGRFKKPCSLYKLYVRSNRDDVSPIITFDPGFRGAYRTGLYYVATLIKNPIV